MTWTRELAEAYSACRAKYPEDRALVVWEIDDTLVEGGPGGGRPCRGVLDIVRWFQAQPLTDVAVCSRRPAADREATAAALAALGREYGLQWRDDLVHLRAGSGDDVAADKRAALRRWRGDGWRVAALVESDPAVLRALAGGDDLEGTALVPAASVLAARRDGARLDGPVEVVWHQVNDPVRLHQFLHSPVPRAEIDLRSAQDGTLEVRHDDISDGRGGARSSQLDPVDVLSRFRAAGKGVDLDLKDASALDEALAAVRSAGLSGTDVRVNGRIDKLGEDGFRAVLAAEPDAHLQCPIEFLGPLVASMPDEARRVVDRLRGWGIDRFSVAWTHPHRALLLDALDGWGFEVNLYAVTDLRQFLESVVTLPRALTADLTVPEWHYFGRGSGNDGEFHRDRAGANVAPGIDAP